MFEVVRSLDFSEKNVAYIALGYYVNENCPHAGLIIKSGDYHFQFHYTSVKIEFSELELDFYHKITGTIDSSEVPAFIAHCNNIKKRANPTYGFFYSGDYFDAEGNHFGDINLGQRMTCVGFCMSTLKGFLENDYIVNSDWEFDPDFKPGYLEYFCSQNSIEIEKIKNSFKRITPGQFLTSGFFDETPIKKSQIDEKYIELKKELINRGVFFD
jgi:hypothetical protein